MILFFLVISILVVPFGFATVGVKEGDLAKYLIETSRFDEFTGARASELYLFTIQVQNVTVTNVTTTQVFQYENGTLISMHTTEEKLNSLYFIELDLDKESVIEYSLFENEISLSINGTIKKTYAHALREVNYVEIGNLEVNTPIENSTKIDLKLFWDKTTGVLCEYSISYTISDDIGSVRISTSVKITETNLWKPERSPLSQWWFWLVIGLLFFCILGLLFTAQRKRKGSNRQLISRL
jgi:hypothetical protein